MNTIAVQDVHVILLWVSDLDRSQQFYGDLLGVPFVAKNSDRVLEYAVGGISLVLHLKSEDERTRKHPAAHDTAAHDTATHDTPAHSIELYFGVHDVDAAVERLRSAGVPIVEEPTLQPWDKRDACVLDPDGNRVHLSSEPIAAPADSAANFRPAA